ncbi:hypothetical protein OGZ39_02270 [Lactococcus lactis]|uniref:Uncharacterized protein n=1 Tax=Lactococcus lactis TaxID=1358 RepID=A0A9X4S1Z6_9LACT|nr:hypothetical protein [Lactococcus lactis]MDG4980482.1 hypothetical protein [Lactococcus lactis]MDT2857610.1 hypothetical protein [Lactococcus lactis]
MKLEISESIEVDTKKLVEEYGQLLTESSKQSIIKSNYKFKGDTKKSVIHQLQSQFSSVKVISKKGRYGGTTFELKEFKNLVKYERENKGGRPSLDWTNELLVIREFINQEVALSDNENFYKGFTINQLFEKLLDFDKYDIEIIAKEEVSIHRIFTLSGNDAEDDYYGLRDTVNNLVRNQRRSYLNLIEKEIKKTNHNINFLNSNGENIDEETYQEYFNFKKQLTKELKAENNKLKADRNQAYLDGINTKDLPKPKNEIQINGEVNNAVQEKFQFSFACRLFSVSDEIQIDGKGDINKVRENFFNRIMKNANSSQSKHEKTQEINYSETVFYRLVHSGQYVRVMKSFFTKLIDIESKLIDEVEEDPEAKQRHLDNVELYMAEQRLEQEEEFYNQDIYIDIERILYEQQAQEYMTDEEWEEKYLELLSY